MSGYQAIFILDSEEETRELGRLVGSRLKPGDVLALSGDLGSGKTTFIQGVARGMGLGEEYYVTSPTFTIINEYPASCPLYHVDLYRLQSGLDTGELGLEEYLESDGVTVIEWADRLPPQALPDITVALKLEFLSHNGRRITFTPVGPQGEERLRQWLQEPAVRQFFKDHEG